MPQPITTEENSTTAKPLGPELAILRAYRTGGKPPGGGPSWRTGKSLTLAKPFWPLSIASVILWFLFYCLFFFAFRFFSFLRRASLALPCYLLGCLFWATDRRDRELVWERRRTRMHMKARRWNSRSRVLTRTLWWPRFGTKSGDDSLRSRLGHWIRWRDEMPHNGRIPPTVCERQSWKQVIYLSIYEGRLFVYHVEISQIRFSFAGLLVPLESPQWLGVHQVGFIMFQPAVEKLLKIEHFFHWKFI
jgi:hypothetical protein